MNKALNKFKQTYGNKNILAFIKELVIKYELPVPSVPKKNKDYRYNSKYLKNYLIYVIQIAWLKENHRVIKEKNNYVFVEFKNTIY